MALGVVRALGEAGVPVSIAHYDARDMAHVSRFVRSEHRVPPPQAREAEFVSALLALAGSLQGALLVPVSDEAVVAIARNAARLAGTFVVAAPPWEVVESFIEKRRTYAIAAAAGVPAPVTVAPRSVEEARELAARVGFPLLVKPSQSHLFYERFRTKMVRVEGVDALVRHVAEAQAAGIEVLLQEIIPGPDSDVVNYNAYAVDGRALVEFTARQLRKAPPRFGSPRVVRSEHVQPVIASGRAMLSALRYDGFACSEFKRDIRDGRYKIVDVNGRHNLSGLLAVRCGINFPLLQYRHLMLGEMPAPTTFRSGLYWVDVLRDAGYSVKHLLDERLFPWEYLAPYVRPHCDAIFDHHDLRPFALRCWNLTRSALGHGRAPRS